MKSFSFKVGEYPTLTLRFLLQSLQLDQNRSTALSTFRYEAGMHSIDSKHFSFNGTIDSEKEGNRFLPSPKMLVNVFCLCWWRFIKTANDSVCFLKWS